MSTSQVAGDQPVVDVVGVDADRDLVAVRQRLAVRVGRLVPVRVADQREALARLVGLEHVRAGGDHVLLVLRRRCPWPAGTGTVAGSCAK